MQQTKPKKLDPSFLSTGEPQIVSRDTHDIHDLKVDDQLLEWFSRPSPEDFMSLVKSILSEGVREPIHVWDRGADGLFIVDGFTRRDALLYIEDNNLTPTGSLFKPVVKITKHHFSSLDEAKYFMNQIQISERRNITPWEKTFYVGWKFHYLMNKLGTDLSTEEQIGEIAKEHDIAPRTVYNSRGFYLGVNRLIELNRPIGLAVKNESKLLTREQVQMILDLNQEQVRSVGTIPELKELITEAVKSKKKRPTNPKLSITKFNKQFQQLNDRFAKKPTKENYDKLHASILEHLERLRGLIT